MRVRTQGVYARGLQGNASAPEDAPHSPLRYHAVASVVAGAGLRLATGAGCAEFPVRDSKQSPGALFRALSSPRAEFATLLKRVAAFVCDECIPAEEVYEKQHEAGDSRWVSPPVMEELKARARELGLWNLFLPKEYPEGAGLTNFECALPRVPRPVPRTEAHAANVPGPAHADAQLAEVLGTSFIASEACNCSAPDTGNMEVLAKYGTAEQKARWLAPLLRGEIRSAFLMTEPDVASSDATNIATRIERDGDEYVITGRKWWSSGAMDARCTVAIVMGVTDATTDTYKRQSMIIVPMVSSWRACACPRALTL